MNPELKDLIRPPFYKSLGWIRDQSKQDLFKPKFGSVFTLNSAMPEEMFVDFLVAALNEKWERDFGELVRWKFNELETDCIYYCPKCTAGNDDRTVKFCPECGQRLDPPEEAQDA